MTATIHALPGQASWARMGPIAVSSWLRGKGDVFGGSDICCLAGLTEGFQPYAVLACRVVA